MDKQKSKEEGRNGFNFNFDLAKSNFIGKFFKDEPIKQHEKMMI